MKFSGYYQPNEILVLAYWISFVIYICLLQLSLWDDKQCYSRPRKKVIFKFFMVTFVGAQSWNRLQKLDNRVPGYQLPGDMSQCILVKILQSLLAMFNFHMVLLYADSWFGTSYCHMLKKFLFCSCPDNGWLESVCVFVSQWYWKEIDSICDTIILCLTLYWLLKA